MRKIFLLLLLLIFLLPLNSDAFSLISNLGGQRSGTASLQFLKIGVGARAAGLGDNFVALADDPTTLYWNPAGIASFEGNEIIFTHTEWAVDIDYEFTGIIWKAQQEHTLGLSCGVLHTAEMDVTTEYAPRGTGETFTYGDFLLGLTYARELTDRFAFGITAKYVQENLDNLTIRTGLLDLGMFFKTGFQSLRIGTSLLNFGYNVKPSGESTYYSSEQETATTNDYESFPVPTLFKFGMAYDAFNTGREKLTSAFEMNHSSDGSENLRLGSEFLFSNILVVRVGYKFNTSEEGLCAGGGINNIRILGSSASIDYAYTDFGRLGNTHQLSLGMKFYH